MFKCVFFFSEYHCYTWKEKKNAKRKIELFLHILLKWDHFKRELFKLLDYEMILIHKKNQKSFLKIYNGLVFQNHFEND